MQQLTSSSFWKPTCCLSMPSSCARYSGFCSIQSKVSLFRIGSGRYWYSSFCISSSRRKCSSISMVASPSPPSAPGGRVTMSGCTAPFDAPGATLVLARSSSSCEQNPELGRCMGCPECGTLEEG